MLVKVFQVAWEQHEASRPFSDPIAYRQYRVVLREAAGPEHSGKPFTPEGSMSDYVHCSCGWKSQGYWDMAEAAWDEWAKHVADEMGITPQQCACGKDYIPANGESACHELTPVSSDEAMSPAA